jgi:DNA polymerase
LREQVKRIQPRIIVCLGRISAMRLIKEDFKITKEHGVWFEKGTYLMTAVYHPAALLRNPSQKDAMLTDMKAIRARLDALNS